MNLLLDRLPKSVVVEGVKYPIYTDFRGMILFEQIMTSDDLMDHEKSLYALGNFYPEAQPPPNEAVEYLLWFYRVGKEPEKPKGDENEIPRRQPKVYSYEHDAAYIFAAFLDQYGIDLNTEEIHWWKFRAMMDGLREDHIFSKIVGYRSMVITNDMTDSQKRFYREQKLRYALPDERTEEEREDDFANALANLF